MNISEKRDCFLPTHAVESDSENLWNCGWREGSVSQPDINRANATDPDNFRLSPAATGTCTFSRIPNSQSS